MIDNTLPTIIKNLLTNKSTDWIKHIDDSTYDPYVVQLWLSMIDELRVQVRWLDKYVFVLPPKMYLSLAWSILPKDKKVPYSKYIKKIDETEEYDFILKKVRQHFKMADNDYNHMKGRLLTTIKKDMVQWFSFYGIVKKYWKQYYLNFDLIKEFNKKETVNQLGLNQWGL